MLAPVTTEAKKPGSLPPVLSGTWRSAVLLIILAAACSGETESGPEAVLRMVRVSTAQPATAEEALRVSGEVRGTREVQVFAQVAEKIRTVHVEDGAQVTVGQPMLTLSAELPSAGLQQASAALQAARIERDRLRAELARSKTLLTEGAVARADVERLRAALDGASAQVQRLVGAERAAGQQRARTVVRAPIDGVVTHLEAEQGMLATPQFPVASVVQFEQVEVRLQLAEADFVRVKKGMEAEVNLPAIPGFRRTGRVNQISPVLDRRTRTGRCDLLVENTDGQLRPGMTATVRLVLSRHKQVILLPASAVLEQDDVELGRRNHVFVERNGKVKMQAVERGRRFGREIAITRGLKSGDRVVTEGQHLLQDGADVRVVSRRKPAQADGLSRIPADNASQTATPEGVRETAVREAAPP